MKNKTIKTKEIVKYPLFKTEAEEKAYYEEFPTIYHLRKHLMDSKEDDLRKIYLGIHHILKYRGHFTNQGQKFDLKNINIAENLSEVLVKFEENSGFDFGISNVSQDKPNKILNNRYWSRQKKAFELNEYYKVDAEVLYRSGNERFIDEYEELKTENQKNRYIDNLQKQLKALFIAIVGNSIDLKTIFNNDDYKPSDENQIPRGGDFKYGNDNFDEKLAELDGKILAEEIEIIELGKKVYEAIILSKILTKEDLSSSMIEKYNLHAEQLKKLKKNTRLISHDLYQKLFKKDGLYEIFIKGIGNPAKVINRDEFYKSFKKLLESEFDGLKFPETDKDFDFSKVEISEELQKYFIEISELMKFDNFLPKQRTSDNGAIPYQVHEYELLAIVERQKEKFPFLAETCRAEIEDENGNIEKKKEYKIDRLFKFRIPYYIGTLAKEPGWRRNDDNLQRNDNSLAKNSWLVRSDEKITPWNFDQIVDKEASASNFIERMTNFDSYLPEEKVLPDNSLLYQEFKIFNELIVSGYWQTIQGKRSKFYFDSELRQAIFNDLFKKNKKVTAKMMLEYLNNVHQISVNNSKDFFGIDTFVKNPSYNTSYSTYIDLKNAGISDEIIEKNKDKFEQIIKWQTIFEDKKVLRKNIKNANDEWQILSSDQVKKLGNKHYIGWGRISKKLLSGIQAKNGKTIIENLKENSYNNFARLLEDERISETIKKAQTKNQKESGLSYEVVEDLAGSPAIKKGIWQSLKIIGELEKYLGRENISKIVIEMSRENGLGRTQKRKKKVENFYKTFKEKTGEEINSSLKKELDDRDESEFNNEKMYLYFVQNGKCMYSGESLDLDELSNYEVDHIIPQTFIKDDSFDNKVLVKRAFNQSKGGDTPTEAIIRKMRGYWLTLARNGQISKNKLTNLMTKSGTFSHMSDSALHKFINRQLVENRQITKHVANILSAYFYGSAEILTPKSALTSQFRQGVVYIPRDKFDFVNMKNYEFEGRFFIDSDRRPYESKYVSSKFVKYHYHDGFPKNRDLNDYHHAHDAFLNAVIATYIYRKFPEYKEMWVYGEYQKKKERISGKYGLQRQDFSKLLLSGMADDFWDLTDPDTGEMKKFDVRFVLNDIKKTLGYRDVNIVKKVEMQLGKFGDESIYKKDEKAKNFSNGVKNDLDPNKYGGTKAPISAFTAVIKTSKGDVKPVSISVMYAEDYLNSKDKLNFIRKIYPEYDINEILINTLPKYTKYILPNLAIRLLASFQEGQNGIDLPMFNVANEKSTDEALLDSFNNLAGFIEKNKLFAENKITTLGVIREKFIEMNSEDKSRIIEELLRVTKGSNQNLKILQKAGLGTTAQRLKSGNTITNNTVIVRQSVTGLQESRIILE